MDPTLILFAISAAVKLGQKFYEVLVDANRGRPLFLPLGDLFGSISEAEATTFFSKPENVKLVRPGGPYAGLEGEKLVEAYRSLLAVNQQLGNPPSIADQAVDLIRDLHEFEQFKEGFGPASPVVRLIGVLVEIGVDYFQANPQALGQGSPARKVVEAFITGIKPIDFENDAEGKLRTIPRRGNAYRALRLRGKYQPGRPPCSSPQNPEKPAEKRKTACGSAQLWSTLVRLYPGTTPASSARSRPIFRPFSSSADPSQGPLRHSSI